MRASVTLDATPFCVGDAITWRVDQQVVDSAAIRAVRTPVRVIHVVWILALAIRVV